MFIIIIIGLKRRSPPEHYDETFGPPQKRKRPSNPKNPRKTNRKQSKFRKQLSKEKPTKSTTRHPSMKAKSKQSAERRQSSKAKSKQSSKRPSRTKSKQPRKQPSVKQPSKYLQLILILTHKLFSLLFLYVGPLSIYVDRLKKVYRAPPPNWNPLPTCEHIKLAMIRVKGMRRGEADETMVKQQVKGEVEAIVASRVPIEVDKIFDSGLFDEERQVILVEGGPGMGKTTLAYHFGQEWAKGNLKIFGIVALVSLCDIAITPTSTLADLLLLACGRKVGNLTEEMIEQHIISGPRFLLILDGWDEAPNQIRKVSFVTNILQSLPLQSTSKLLITARSDSSVVLHDLANRVEIIGFTKENIHKYFQRALSTELEDDKVEGECRKLREHFYNHPVIQSCCSSPLNAAILAQLYLTDRSLPSTRHELFLKLVLSRINRELQLRRKSQENTVFASSLGKLSLERKEKLDCLCRLAFEGEKQQKVVFSQKELVCLNLQRDISALGLLQIDDSYSSIGEKTTCCYFIHHSIQELLAAYHISQLGEGSR